MHSEVVDLHFGKALEVQRGAEKPAPQTKALSSRAHFGSVGPILLDLVRGTCCSPLEPQRGHTRVRPRREYPHLVRDVEGSHVRAYDVRIVGGAAQRM